MESRVEDLSNYDDLFEIFNGIDPEAYLMTDDPTMIAITEGIGTNYNHYQQQHQQQRSGEETFVDLVLEYSRSPPPSNANTNISKLTKLRRKEVRETRCVACDGKSAGIRSFGALVCMSCRAFFIRSIKDEAYKSFSCRAGNNPQSPACLINSKSRKSCRRCRFDQCLRVGMTIPEPTRTSRIPQVASSSLPMVAVSSQAVTRPGHSLNVQNLLKENFCQAVLGNLREFLMNTTVFTSDDMKNIEQFPSLHVRFTSKVYTDLARMSISKFESTLKSLFAGRWHDLYMQKVIDDYQWFCANDMFLKMTGYPFDCLKYTDRIRLAKFNGPLALEYVLATKCGKVKDNELEFDHFISIMTNDPDEALSCMIKNIYCRVSENGTLRPVPMTYDRMYVPELLGLDNQAEVDRHKMAATKLAQFTQSTSEDKLDPIVHILTFNIVLYSTDFLDLDDPKTVEDIQTCYACLLWRYLKSQRSNRSEAIFRDAMMAISYVREIREVREKAYQRMNNQLQT